MALSIDQKRLRATKFPPEFDKQVDIKKVNIDLMKKWIANKITDILGDEDDIVVETCYNLIEQNQFPKIKEIQIQLTGFLNKDTPAFCKELWDLMLSAQDSAMGVPRELLEAKKLELQQEQQSKAAAEQRLREGQAQNDMIDAFRREENNERPNRSDRFDRPEREEDHHHHVASETYMSQVVDEIVAAVEEAAVIDPVSAAALRRAVALLLHRLVAFDAHPLQIDPEARHAVAYGDRRHHLDPVHRRLVARAVRPLAQSLRHHGGGETSLGRRAMIAEGYPNIPHDLFPR
ncbi:PWI domain-containing protein [Paraphoma chrysanthemicola]|uniref:PWI domain-containing protein n=1 Tax=Paraphoma chrysanthemicola TaxID=798071 RepID=A0A8K0R735_9PLEO|nr:PWI domain-containing protein [Paraphoma chrysanthemicola]